MPSLHVINLRGEREPFSFKKVYNSARRVGASKEAAKEIAQIIEDQVYPGIKTSKIYKKVKKLLRQKTPKAALKFDLKVAMRKLGPTGFPFEKFIGEIFSKKGFKVKLNQFPQGKCLKYEVDFLAQKDDLFYIGECKYRRKPGGLVHSDTALANFAQFLDLKKGEFLNQEKFRNFKTKTILVTNAKFTSHAIKYSECKGAELLGWRYPPQEGLEHLIEAEKLYPITILPSFKKPLVKVFSKKRIILAKDVLQLDLQEFSSKENIPINQLQSLKEEAKVLLK